MARPGDYRKPHLIAVLCFLLLLPSACSYRDRTKATLAPPPIDFLDLKPGSTVQVVVPLTRSGSYVLPSIRQSKPDDLEINTDSDFIGYQRIVYKVVARGDGGVQVRFKHATDWRNGKTSTAGVLRLYLFEDLAGHRYFRLVFLTRESQADHNMAIVAASDPGSLRALTEGVVQRAVCPADATAICRWVPEGVAVTVDAQ